MFYQGDLQSGISVAVQQSKLVTCFVRDDEDESTIWEEDFLQDTALSQLLLERTLLLRLRAGSQEAGFLAAIYPLPKTPTLVIIHSNGQLKEYLTSGISKTDFINRVKLALNDGTLSSIPATGEDALPEHDSDLTLPSTGSRDQLPAEEGQSLRVGELLAERRARLESKKKEQDAAEKAEKAAKAKARREALETAAIDTKDPKRAADMKYALIQKNRQQEARSERARILQRVEDDKAERRAKEALRKEQANATMEPTNTRLSTAMHPVSSALQRPFKDQRDDCALQVRLFDGSTIRSRFSLENTLGEDVRRWIDSHLAGNDIPYTFKQVLTPHPNKIITVSEENESLRYLGLVPSATLILVPVKDFTSAYGGSTTSYITRGIYAGAELVSSSINLVTGTLGSLLGGSATPGADTEAEIRPSQAPAPSSIRTFSERRRSLEEHQLYNGNTLNFEPRRDENDEGD